MSQHRPVTTEIYLDVIMVTNSETEKQDILGECWK